MIEFVEHAGIDLIRGLLSILKALADGLLYVTTALIESVNSVLIATIYVPFFKPLYQKLVGKKPSVLNILSLLAIPATILHKVMFNSAPEDLTDAKLDSIVSRPLGSKANGVNKFGTASYVSAIAFSEMLGILTAFIPFPSRASADSRALGPKTLLNITIDFF